jgi:2-polyprenyl-3-methyl-5-hydroxy-6-metoxy-1,4-benzoquinol methylase
VTSLNRETGRDRYFAARERELEALLDPRTGMLSEQFAHRVSCPLCGSDEHEQLFVKHGFTFVRCPECELVFSNPQVDESLVVAEYRGGTSNDLWVDVLTSPRQLELDRGKFGSILDELEPYRGGGRLLDVGCSIGLFLDLARERGWDGLGIEFGERALRHAREKLGLEVLDVPLEDAGFADASFDAVALLSVIEHVNEPRQLMRELRRVLRPGGALYLITPNVESLACRLLHERAATFDGRNHLVYFSPRTIRRVLSEAGFEPVSVSTRVSSLEAMLEWLSYREPYAEDGTGDDPLAAWAREHRTDLERLLLELDLGYKLHVLALRS